MDEIQDINAKIQELIRRLDDPLWVSMKREIQTEINRLANRLNLLLKSEED